jgi:hypothetical protein
MEAVSGGSRLTLFPPELGLKRGGGNEKGEKEKDLVIGCDPIQA